jgi:hypothetical protein
VLKRTAHLTVAVSERPEKVVAVATDGEKRPRRRQGPARGSKKAKATAPKAAKE